jgi:flagellar biosynthetic protein FliQ
VRRPVGRLRARLGRALHLDLFDQPLSRGGTSLLRSLWAGAGFGIFFGGGFFVNEDLIIRLGQDALKTTAMLSAPILISTLVVGLLVSVFQALTQINEATLTFIPKMLVVALVIVLAGPWMMDLMTVYTVNLFESIATVVREN